MSKQSHTQETFSHFIVALIIVVAGFAIVAWGFSMDHTCPAGQSCKAPPAQVHY